MCPRIGGRDVMEAGGWKNDETLLRSYQQPDAETVKRVVLHPTQRIMSCWDRVPILRREVSNEVQGRATGNG